VLKCQELPSNIILRKVGARNWLSFIVLGFGAVMTGMAFVKEWWQLAICRTLLGLLEGESVASQPKSVRLTLLAGFFPGCVLVISAWYTRYETNSRLAVFYLTSMVISGFSNIFGFAITQLNGRAGLIAWQWSELWSISRWTETDIQSSSSSASSPAVWPSSVSS
jgi:MFS family permease